MAISTLKTDEKLITGEKWLHFPLVIHLSSFLGRSSYFSTVLAILVLSISSHEALNAPYEAKQNSGRYEHY